MDYEHRIADFERELTHLINKYSLENRSNTPDYILAKFLVMSLICADQLVGVREAWYGRSTEVINSTTERSVASVNDPK